MKKSLNKRKIDEFLNDVHEFGIIELQRISESELNHIKRHILAEMSEIKNLAFKRYSDTISIIGKDELPKEQQRVEFWYTERYYFLQHIGNIIEPTKEKTEVTPKEITFLDLLNERGKQIAPKLIKLYPSYTKHPQTKRFAYLIIALDELELTSKRIQDLGSTRLKNLLRAYFGHIGTYQALGQSLKLLKEDLPNSYLNDIKEEYKRRCEEINQLLD
jgi:hypothetical protein